MNTSKYILDYENGKTIWDIAIENDDTYKNVYRVVTGKVFWAKNLPDYEKQKICDLYLSGKSTVEIGQMYGINNKPIAKVLEENGIERDRGLSTRIYQLDEHYFDNIDSPNKAYIYGLLQSDGSNNPGKATVSISLQEEDFDILEKVRIELKSEKPLEFLDYSNKHDFGYTYKNQYRLLLFSRKICNALTNHGLVQNKSLILEFPKDIPDEFMMHMIRGMWDGDGSIGLYKAGVSISLTSTEMFCNGLRDYLLSHYEIRGSIYDAQCHNGVTRNFSINRLEDKIKFLNLLYENADLYLERKYQNQLRIYDYYNNRKSNQ